VTAWRITDVLRICAVLALISGTAASHCPARAQEPRPAPDYAARILGREETAALAGLRGRVVLLNAFATWCAPCRAEMPDFQAAYRSLRDRGLEVVGVNVDEGEADEKVERFVEKLGIEFPVWRDPSNRFSKRFRALGVPETVLIGRDGTILRHWNGPMDPGDPENRAAIEEALGTGTPCPAEPMPERAMAQQRGRRLAEQRGCLSCHATTDGPTGAGPAWQHLRGTEVTLDDGRKISRDSAYLARAIREPNAEVVAGYERGVMAGAMPGKTLTDEEVAALVLFLESL
jgi:peroxiredoxin